MEKHIVHRVFLIYCLRFVYPMLSVSLDFQYLLSTSVFPYVYLASVVDTFLFHWIHLCFDDFMQESMLTTSGIDLNTFQMMVCIVCDYYHCRYTIYSCIFICSVFA